MLKMNHNSYSRLLRSMLLVMFFAVPLESIDAAIIGIGYNNFKITHTFRGLGAIPDNVVSVGSPAAVFPVGAARPLVNPNLIPGGLPAPFQYGPNLALADPDPLNLGNVSLGSGGIASLFNFGLGAIAIPAGTGVSQNAPNGPHGSAVLRIDYDIDFLTNAGGFNNWDQFANFNIGGNIGPGAGSFAKFSHAGNFFSNGVPVGPGTAINQQWGAGGGGAVGVGGIFAQLFSQQNGALANVPANGTLTMTGFIEFEVLNDGGPTDIQLTEVAGSAPPEVLNAVPIPGALWLFVSGFMTFLGFAYRKKHEKV